jgi:hypothetical protein
MAKNLLAYKCDNTTGESLCYKVNEFMVLELDRIGYVVNLHLGNTNHAFIFCTFSDLFEYFYGSSVCSNFKRLYLERIGLPFQHYNLQFKRMLNLR